MIDQILERCININVIVWQSANVLLTRYNCSNVFEWHRRFKDELKDVTDEEADSQKQHWRTLILTEYEMQHEPKDD